MSGVHPYELERLAAERRADYEREAEVEGNGRRGGRVRVWAAGALRGVADRLDGGRRTDAGRLGTARAID